jgi:anti-sigma factor RsiW
MSLSEPFDDRLMADLAAAADGTLDPARQAEIEALAAADAEVADALERQRRAVALIRGASADVHAPPALRARLEAEGRRAARDQPSRGSWRRSPAGSSSPSRSCSPSCSSAARGPSGELRPRW